MQKRHGDIAFAHRWTFSVGSGPVVHCWLLRARNDEGRAGRGPSVRTEGRNQHLHKSSKVASKIMILVIEAFAAVEDGISN